MEILSFILSFIVFLFILYLLFKDDYVFIRKNFLLDQLYDLVFVGLIGGLILGRLITIFLTYESNFFAKLFIINNNLWTLSSIIIGFFMSYFLGAKIKKLPVGRTIDFFSVAILGSLPVGYLIYLFFQRRSLLLIYLAYGLVYFLIFCGFWRYLLPRAIKNIFRPGTLGAIFLAIFSMLSFIMIYLFKTVQDIGWLNKEAYLCILFFVGSLIFVFLNEYKKIARKKSN